MHDEHFCEIMWNQVHEWAKTITSTTNKTAFKSLVTKEPLSAIVL